MFVLARRLERGAAPTQAREVTAPSSFSVTFTWATRLCRNLPRPAPRWSVRSKRQTDASKVPHSSFSAFFSLHQHLVPTTECYLRVHLPTARVRSVRHDVKAQNSPFSPSWRTLKKGSGKKQRQRPHFMCTTGGWRGVRVACECARHLPGLRSSLRQRFNANVPLLSILCRGAAHRE